MFYLNVYSVLNALSEYTYFYISKNIASYTFLLVLKIDESLHCILRNKYNFTLYQKTFLIGYPLPISIDQINIFSNILYIYNKMGVTWTYVWYISWSPNDHNHCNHPESMTLCCYSFEQKILNLWSIVFLVFLVCKHELLL